MMSDWQELLVRDTQEMPLFMIELLKNRQFAGAFRENVQK
jgi:hypothetical protein